MRKIPDNTGKRRNFSGMNPGAWTLHKKILLSMVALLLLSGLTTALITRTVLLEVLKTEFQQKGVSSARSLAANAVVDILTQNSSRLKQLVENEKKLDKDIAYIFIVDSSDRVLAHTFNKGFPVDLLKSNKLQTGQTVHIQPLDTSLGLIYDIAAPVLLDKNILSEVHIGIPHNNIQEAVVRINLILLAATMLIVLIGIFLVYKISSFVTRPVSKLVAATQSIQKGDFSVKIDIKTEDEIGQLASAFNEMAYRLNDMVDQVKRLTTIEERNRIGLDLHDGCAQDLASIIKRIELCEKLFKMEPAKALGEMQVLRENTRDILNRTRQIIFELKSPEQISAPDLYNKLNDYAKEFQKQNGIRVELNLPSTLNNILTGEYKSIFFIITEAFANIRKHSSARNVKMGLDIKDSSLIINIKDDGRGFDTDNTGSAGSGYGRWGLAGMRQRAASLGGSLAIRSVPNQGTEIRVTIPLAKA